MKSLIYLLRKTLKNTLKELIHKPAKLLTFLFVAASIIAMMVMSLFIDHEGRGGSGIPHYWFQGGLFAFLVFFMLIIIRQGLASGETMFDMSDVNLLFVAPVNPRKILLYGIIRLAKTAFIASFFMLFQGANLVNFGFTAKGMFPLFFMFLLTMFMLSLLSIVIYSATNGRPRRQLLVKIVTALCFVPLVVFFLVQYFQTGNAMTALAAACRSVWLTAFPLIGWAAAAMLAFLQGSLLTGFLWTGLILLAGVGMVAYIMLSRSDYYEDVLVATETAFERKRAVAEGSINTATTLGTKKVKVKATGLRGNGAQVLFFKHLRETFRESRLGFFTPMNIGTLVMLLVLAFTMKDELDVTFFLPLTMWMQAFFVGMGRGLKEIYNPYIYLIPESPFKKIVWANLEMVFKSLLESAAYLLVPALILKNNLLVALVAMLVYTLFTLFLIGLNLLSIRVIQTNISNGLVMMIYIVAIMIFMAPGLIPALILGFSLGGSLGTVIGLLIIAGWELIAGLVCFYIAKDVLNSCDMPIMNMYGKNK